LTESGFQNSDKYVLAVDHGTSGVKCALISVYGKCVATSSQSTPLILLPNGGAEQNPDDWWNAFLISAKNLMDQKKVRPEQIVAVCVSGQWSVTVPVDQNGNHLMNAISWMDSRGAPYIRRLVKGIINISGYAITNIIKMVHRTGGGPGLSGKDPTSHILYLKNERPEIYRHTYKFLECKDYMNLKLTGKFAATTDSIHLHWVTNSKDLNNIYYDPVLLKFYGIDREKLPDLIKPTDILGPILPNIADTIGIPRNTPVLGGSGDLQMAAIGSGAVRDYETHIYIGTSAFLVCHIPYKKTDILHNIGAIPSANPKKYFVATEQETAGACLTFMRDNILYYHTKEPGPQAYDELDNIAKQIPPGSDGLIFTPWLYGERTPIEDHTVRGGILNLSLQHSLYHIIRASFEGIAYNARWVLKYVERFVGNRKLDPINIIGGGAISDVWCQIYADVLNRNIRRVVDPIRANARGAALVASVGLGYLTFEDIPNYIEYDRIFKPNPDNRKIYDTLFDEFVEIYKKMAPIYRRLNGLHK
jgi:xylulokinase